MVRIAVAAALAAGVAALPASARPAQEASGFLVFVTDRGGTADIYSSDAAGGRAVPLVATRADEVDPDVAPRGRALAWASDADGTWQVYTAGSGSPARRLTSGPASNVEPVWSPTGRQLAFESDRTGNWEIFVMNADGTGVRNVSRRAADDFDPVWQDAKTVVFTGVEAAGGTNLYRTTVAAPRPAALTRTAAHESDPAFAPDGSRISLTQLYGADYEIAVTSARAIRTRRLTTSPGLDVAPEWTTDGRHLVFTSDRTHDLELFRIPAGGGEPVNLTGRPGSNEWEADATAVVPKLSIRRLATHGPTAVPWFTCANPSPIRDESPWFVVEGTTAAPPAAGDNLCGNNAINRVFGFAGRDKLFGGPERDHMEGGGHSDLLLSVGDRMRDCVYGGSNALSAATVGRLCLDGRLASLTVYSDGVADTAWPDKGIDLVRGAKVEP